MDITTLRRKIDDIDEQILDLLTQRAEIALQIGKEKNRNNLSVLSKEREIEIIQRLVTNNKSPLSDEDIRNIFSTIILICRNIQIA